MKRGRFRRFAIAILMLGNCHALVAAETAAQIRLNQVGYSPGDAKQAILLATGDENGAKFEVVSSKGVIALESAVGQSIGSWNRTYSKAYLLDFSSVKESGIYSVKVAGSIPAVSTTLKVAPRQSQSA